MNIAFVIPPSPRKRKIIRLIDCSHEAKADYLWQPSDFMIISSLLGPVDNAVLVDGTADEMGEGAFFELLQRLQPDLVFFALSGVCWESDYQFFLKTRLLFNSKSLYVIGDIFQEREYLECILRVCDGVVFNPFQLHLSKMAELRETRDAILPGVRIKPDADWKGPEKTIVTSNFPRHELFLKEGYLFPFARHLKFATVTTLWGCPFSCSYCPDSSFQPVVRCWNAVVKELEHLEVLGVRELFFADKAFGYPADNIIPLLEVMATKFRFSWTCYFHPQLYSAKLLELMKTAGCHTLIVGIESADQEGLGRYNRKVDKGRIEELTGHAVRVGMNVCGDFIIGLEHETEEDICKTLHYALQLPLDYASFNIAAPFPGTDVRKKAISSGKMTFGREGYDTLTHAGELGISSVSYEKIRRLRNKAIIRFYLRPSYLLRRMKKTVSFEHFLIQCRQMLAMCKKIW